MINDLLFSSLRRRSNQKELNWDIGMLARWGCELDGQRDFFGWGRFGRGMGAGCD